MTYSTQDQRLPVSEPWIALIKRGQCEFAVKVLNAILSNASAVLIYNDKETHILDKMSIPPELSEYIYFDALSLNYSAVAFYARMRS
jgi:hypothetical protein